jgi:hypothetical protein
MEIIKYGLGIVIGMILGTIYFTVFDNKGLGIEFVTDTKIKKEYVTVFKDTCAVVQNKVSVTSRYKPGKVIGTEVTIDSIIEDNDTTIVVDDRLRTYLLSSRNGAVSIYDTLNVRGYYIGTKRGVKLDTLEIQSMFTNTVVVNPEREVEYVKITTPESSLLFTGTIYTNRDYGLGLMYKTKQNHVLGMQYNMISKTISLTAGIQIIKWK